MGWPESLRIGSRKLLALILVSFIAGTTAFSFYTDERSALILEMKTSVSNTGQIFWDSGSGYNEKESHLFKLGKADAFETYEISLPGAGLQSIRIDPLCSKGIFEIKSIRLKGYNREYLWTGKDLAGKLAILQNISNEEQNIRNYRGIATTDDPALALNDIPSTLFGKKALLQRILISTQVSLAAFFVLLLLNVMLQTKLKHVLFDNFTYLVFSLCLIVSIYHMFAGFNNAILDRHDFRQTQTAISTYYMVQDGFTLAYETPVLGKPWSLPFEFPLYQWTTAAFVLISGVPLDQAGRLISIFFYYCSLVAMYFIVKNLSVRKKYIFVVLSLILMSPIYMFWSRTFMIESMALFFSLVYIAFFTAYFKDGKNLYLFCMILSGVLAGLAKTTTFIVASIPVIVAISYRIYQVLRNRFDSGDRGQSLFKLVPGYLNYVLMIGVPYGVAYLWTLYADNVRKVNPLAGFLSNNALRSWYFGTLNQRMSHDFWDRMYHWTINHGVGTSLVVFILLLMIHLNRKYLLIICLSLITFIAGPLIFSNLYWRHDYYHYANLIYLLLAIGLSLVALLEARKTALLAMFIILPLLLYAMFQSYKDNYYSDQTAIYTVPAEDLLLRKITPRDTVLFIEDRDWSATTAYYAQRRSIMNRPKFALSDPALHEAVGNVGESSISAFITNTMNSELVSHFKLHAKPIYANIYLREDDYRAAYRKLFHVDVSHSIAVDTCNMTYYKNEFRFLANPDCDAVIPLEGAETSFKIVFGVMDDPSNSVSDTDFEVTHVKDNGVRTIVFKRHLDPFAVPADQGPQETAINLNKLGKGKLLLRAYPGNSTSGNRAFWSSMELI